MPVSDTAVKDTVKIAEPRMWVVILHNDDFTPMEFVIHVLTDLFHKSEDEAEVLMLAVHEEGSARVATYTKEVALTKVKHAMEIAEAYGHPLAASAEPE